MVFEYVKVPVLVLLLDIMAILLVLGADELLQELHLPKLWELLEFLHDLVKVLVQEAELEKRVVHGHDLNEDGANFHGERAFEAGLCFQEHIYII